MTYMIDLRVASIGEPPPPGGSGGMMCTSARAAAAVRFLAWPAEGFPPGIVQILHGHCSNEWLLLKTIYLLLHHEDPISGANHGTAELITSPYHAVDDLIQEHLMDDIHDDEQTTGTGRRRAWRAGDIFI